VKKINATYPRLKPRQTPSESSYSFAILTNIQIFNPYFLQSVLCKSLSIQSPYFNRLKPASFIVNLLAVQKQLAIFFQSVR